MGNTKKKMMTAAIAGSLAAAMVVGGGTFAYLSQQTDQVTNEFKPNHALVEISETENDYEIIPGTEQDKDPSLTPDVTLDSYLYAIVTDETEGLVTYEVADGWTEIPELADGTKKVYYRKVTAAETGTSFPILRDNKVSYDKAITNDMMKDDAKLKFRGFVIQAEPFKTAENSESDAALAAYNQTAPAFVNTTSGLKNSITNAPRDNTPVSVVVEDDVDDAYGFKTQKGQNVDVDLDGNTVKILNAVGSTGTETQGMQVLKGSTLTVKNGTFSPSPENDNFLWAIHTYGDLTLENVTIDMTDNTNTTAMSNSSYGAVLICDYGKTTVKGDTNLIASTPMNWAVQVEDGRGTYYNQTGEATTVEFDESMTGTVDGLIIMSDLANGNPETKPELIIKGGTFKNTGLTLDQFKEYVPDGFGVTENTDGSWTVTKNS